MCEMFPCFAISTIMCLTTVRAFLPMLVWSDIADTGPRAAVIDFRGDACKEAGSISNCMQRGKLGILRKCDCCDLESSIRRVAPSFECTCFADSKVTRAHAMIYSTQSKHLSRVKRK